MRAIFASIYAAPHYGRVFVIIGGMYDANVAKYLSHKPFEIYNEFAMKETKEGKSPSAFLPSYLVDQTAAKT